MAESEAAPAQRSEAIDAPADEVSLRELYLTFRAGLPLIVVVAVLVGAVVLGYVLSQPRKFEAAAVVHVLPTALSPSIAVTTTLSPPLGVDLETYRATALAPSAVDAIATATSLEPERFVRGLALSPTPAAQLTRGQQVVRHSATMEAAEAAANVANAWAHATVAELRRVMSHPFQAAIAAAQEEMSRREAEFDAASSAWSEFLARDERPALRARLAAEGASDTTSDTTEVRAALAELEGAASAAQRDLAAAQLAYYRSAPLLAQLELQRDLATESAVVAVEASPPLGPLSRNLLLLTLGSAMAAGLLATLFVFLRRAVSP